MAQAKVPFNILSVQWKEIENDARPDIDGLFEKSAFCLGPYVEALEKDLCAYLNVKHALCVNSGTSALHLAMLAAGIKAGDEVLLPSHTFIATAWGVLYAGATPILCDVDEATGNIDVKDAARRLTSKTKAIIPVHLYGQPAQMDEVAAFAKQNNLIVVEDTAQAFGASWNGKKLGTIGLMGCYSFYPGKNLGGAGEGGLIVTNDDTAAAQIRSLRNHGQSERYLHNEIGYNYRMDGFQGIILRHKLRRIDTWTARRKEIAAALIKGLAGLPLQVPQIVNQDHVWHLFVVRTPDRDKLRAYLTDKGIETGLHYPVPNHKQPCLAYLNAEKGGALSVSDKWASQGLSLPLFYGMTDEQVAYVINTVREYFGR